MIPDSWRNMNGEIAHYLVAAAKGDPGCQALLKKVFEDDFQTWSGWFDALKCIPLGVDHQLRRNAEFWGRNTFQALYIASWLYHPSEKGSYMLRLPDGNHAKEACDALLKTGALETRESSHLSRAGISAHRGWHFLRGYHELLLQVENQSGAEYLFLKAEGHSTVGTDFWLHGLSFVKKQVTGSGFTANEDLKHWAENYHTVESRAAENFDKGYEKLLTQLGLTSRNTTVAEVVDALCKKSNTAPVRPDYKTDTHKLGTAMMKQDGFIDRFKSHRATLFANGVDFDDEAADELWKLAKRMLTPVETQTAQNYHEVRMAAWEVDVALGNFEKIISNG